MTGYLLVLGFIVTTGDTAYNLTPPTPGRSSRPSVDTAPSSLVDCPDRNFVRQSQDGTASGAPIRYLKAPIYNNELIIDE